MCASSWPEFSEREVRASCTLDCGGFGRWLKRISLHCQICASRCPGRRGMLHCSVCIYKIFSSESVCACPISVSVPPYLFIHCSRFYASTHCYMRFRVVEHYMLLLLLYVLGLTFCKPICFLSVALHCLCNRSIMGKQLAAVISKYNDENPSASIKVIHKDVPTQLQDGEVLVRMMLRPINPSDMFCMRGRYGGFTPKQLPAVPGLEGLGVVKKLGPKTGSRVKVGQRVLAVPWPTAGGEGTYQQYVAVPEKDLVAVPSNVDDDMAAQFLINPVTAFGFLEVIQVPKGEYLLQQAANSVLGKELISMAQKRGTQTINLVRRHEVVNDLKQLGAEHVIVTTEGDVTARVMKITNGKGAWASINPIGGEASRYLPSCTRQGGKVHVFSLFKEEVIVPMFDLHFRQIQIQGFWLTQWLENLPSDQARQEVFDKVMSYFADGTIQSPHASVKYSLDRAQEAVKKAMDGVGGQGKVMLEDKFDANEE